MSINNVDLSIVIVTWNNDREIENCLNSLCDTITSKFEIIIVDNDSDDLTKDKIKKLFPEVILIASSNNLGFARANNLALQKAKGKYVLFLNPDTIMQETTVDKCLTFFEKHPKYGALTCRLLNVDGSTQSSIYKLPSYSGIFIESLNLQNYFPSVIGRLFGYSYHFSHEVECCMGAFILMKRSEALIIEGFTEKFFMYMEDGDLCWKIKNMLHRKIYFLHEVGCVHLGGCSEHRDVSTSKLSKMIDSIVLFWKMRKPERWRFIISYYRMVYGIKLFLAKVLNIYSEKKYKKIIENCRDARRLFKEKLEEA